MKPTIGRIVIYRTTDADKAMFRNIGCNVMEELPAVISGVWGPNVINVKVFVDGPVSDLWKTSINEGTLPGQWMWPPRVEAEVKIEGDGNIVGNGNTQNL